MSRRVSLTFGKAKKLVGAWEKMTVRQNCVVVDTTLDVYFKDLKKKIKIRDGELKIYGEKN